MAESKKTGKTKPAPEENPETRIPTLTEVVTPGSDAPVQAPVEEPSTVQPPAPAAVDQRTLEKLIYRQLSRRLPQLSRDLAADILAELGGNPDKSTDKK